MIEVDHLTRRFGKYVALDNVSFTANKGQVLGLLGPNGAGKTTTVRVLSCLLNPTKGNATIEGLSISDKKDRVKIRSLIGVLTESPSLYYDLTIGDNLKFIGKLYNIPDKEIDEHIDHYVNLFGLQNKTNEVLGNFSKGMKHKVSMMRCLVHNPSVLFFDEPTSGLDPISAKIVRDMIQKLKIEGKTIFLCTHNLYDTTRLCDKIVILKNSVLYEGSPRVTSANPQSTVDIGIKNLSPDLKSIIENSQGLTGEVLYMDDLARFKMVNPDDNLSPLVKQLIESGGKIYSLSDSSYSLEHLYHQLLGDSYV